MDAALGCGGIAFVALSGGLLWAGAPADDPDCEARLEAAVEAISTHPKVKDWSREKLKSTTEFAVGNMLFVLLHEAGHGLISDLGLPVLGREEDAADAFATVTMLQMKTEFTHRTLVNAAKSWLISDRRAREERKTVIYYDVHALDLQRAYGIICLMVGSDGERFEDLANEVNLPDERQETCVFDYSNASWSWEQALKPHLRAPEQQRTTYQIVYGKQKESWTSSNRYSARPGSWNVSPTAWSTCTPGRSRSPSRRRPAAVPAPIGSAPTTRSPCAMSSPRSSFSFSRRTARSRWPS